MFMKRLYIFSIILIVVHSCYILFSAITNSQFNFTNFYEPMLINIFLTLSFIFGIKTMPYWMAHDEWKERHKAKPKPKENENMNDEKNKDE